MIEDALGKVDVGVVDPLEWIQVDDFMVMMRKEHPWLIQKNRPSVIVNGVMRSELVTEVSHRGQAILLFGQFDGEAAALVIVGIED